MKGLFKEVIKISFVFAVVFGATFSYACRPPFPEPSEGQKYYASDVVLVGKVKQSKFSGQELVTNIFVRNFAKTTPRVNTQDSYVDVFSSSSSSECGYTKGFDVDDGIIVMGTEINGKIIINNYSGTLTFSSLNEAEKYYDDNFLNYVPEQPEEASCVNDVFNAFIYDESKNYCFESTFKGCRESSKATLYDSKQECDDANVKEDSTNVCNDNVLRCQDGTVLKRVPPTCAFPACPEFTPEPEVDPEDIWDGKVLCTRDLKRCTDGSYVSRVEPSCEFAKCPVYSEPKTCNNDKKRCDDGTYVKRSGPFCNFEKCNSIKPTDTGEKRCETIWSGYKFNPEKKICSETNIRGCENTLYKTKQECEDENDTETEGIEDSFTNCPLDYIPVCGELDGKQDTYTNKCLMKLEGASLVGEGTCRELNSTYTKFVKWISKFFSDLLNKF